MLDSVVIKEFVDVFKDRGTLTLQEIQEAAATNDFTNVQLNQIYKEAQEHDVEIIGSDEPEITPEELEDVSFLEDQKDGLSIDGKTAYINEIRKYPLDFDYEKSNQYSSGTFHGFGARRTRVCG